MRKLGLLVAFAAVAMVGNNSHASDVTIMADTVTANAGDMGVQVNITATGSKFLKSTDLAFDFGADGDMVLPNGLTFSGAVNANPYSPLPEIFNPNVDNPYDLLVAHAELDFTGNSNGVQLSSTPLTLYTLNFDIASDVVGGTVFEIDLIDNVADFKVNGVIAGGSAVDGRITINGIPEPSSMLLLSVGLVGLASRRRR